VKNCHFGEMVLYYSTKILYRRNNFVIIIRSILILNSLINSYSIIILLFNAIIGISKECIVRLDPYFMRIL